MAFHIPGPRLLLAAIAAGLAGACGTAPDDVPADAAAEDAAPDSGDAVEADDVLVEDAVEADDIGPEDAGGPPETLAWSAPENISGTATVLSDIRYQWGRSLAVDDDGVVHVVWREVSGEAGTLDLAKVVYRRRVGDAWAPVQDISDVVPGTGHPKVAVSGTRVWIVWHTYEPGGADRILFTVSEANGAPGTFAPSRSIVTDAVVTAGNPLGEYSTTPSIAVDGTWTYVVWSDERLVESCGLQVPEIHLVSTSDVGASWSAPFRVSSADCRSSWTPAVAAARGVVHVAWTDERHDAIDCGLAAGACREEEYYRRVAEHGTRLDDPEIRLTTDAPGGEAESWGPSIAAQNDDVQLVWYDRAGGPDFEVFHLRSTDGGSSWEPLPRRLSASASGCRSACATVASDGSAVHAVWFEMCGDSRATIRHAWSNDAGRSWSEVSDVTSGTGVFAVHPHVGVRGDRVHVVWNDNADGEIYFATSR